MKTILSDREQEFEKVCTRYPNKIPVILNLDVTPDAFILPTDPETTSSNIQIKYLISNDMTYGGFLHFIRKKIPDLKPEHGLILLVNEVMPPMSKLMNIDFSQTDFLIVHIVSENVFG